MTKNLGCPTVPMPSLSSTLSPPIHVSDSDLCAVRAVGMRLPNRVVTVWQKGKTKINCLFAFTPRKPRTVRGSAPTLPYEIMEMIIAHLTHDRNALKACSLTCRYWYIAVLPHVHHTLTLGEKGSGKPHGKLKVLSKLHERDLASLVKEMQVCARYRRHPWFIPRTLSDSNLRHFSALTNIRTLKLREVEIYRFIPGIERYFGHFTPMLRSITLWDPRCTPRQLSHFLSLFSNLDDIDIHLVNTNVPRITVPDAELVPISAPKLRGRLTLHHFYWPETWTDLIHSCGGLRFNYIHLYGATGCTPMLLEACAETVNTIRFHVPFIPEDPDGM